jgi:4-aminobutyrate aminotransferase/(S)-3-amino-2-methylpropionate transaminase
MATPYYYRKLRQIASENQIPFIVDETRTGLGSSGKMWAHEHWNLSQGADLVSFGGKTGISGFYSTIDFKLNDLGVSFDQPVDMIKLLNYGVVWQTIQRKNLLSLVQDTGSFLKIEINRVQNEKGVVHNVRGQGTFIGFDAATPSMAVHLQKWLLCSGNHLLRCGP